MSDEAQVKLDIPEDSFLKDKKFWYLLTIIVLLVGFILQGVVYKQELTKYQKGYYNCLKDLSSDYKVQLPNISCSNPIYNYDGTIDCKLEDVINETNK